MKIGILSDTHDNLFKIEKAVRFFNKRKVDFVLHAGDFIAPFTIFRLKDLNCDWRGVFGNNDGERKGLTEVSEGRIQEGPLQLNLFERKFILVHDIKKINLFKYPKEIIVIFGHTHRPQIKKERQRLLINPGECGGWLTRSSTIAILNLDFIQAKIFEI
ncbi:MAG: metallophosphoesterase [Candidatus Omnitrophica bacterium]|nr:metallophosphoesterase [Candidatus Omnitrophota bacterium]